MRRASSLSLFAAVMLAASGALAQQRPCSEGRVRSAASQGRCCWPGQSWSASLARCDGPPVCPAGFVEEGDACARAQPGAPTREPAAPAPTPPVAPAPPPVVTAPVAAVVAPVAVSEGGPVPTPANAGIAPDGTIRYGVLPEGGAPSAPFSRAPVAPLPVPGFAPALQPSPPAAVYVAAPAPAAREPHERREPYVGGPVPPGARVEARVNLGLVISGPLVFVTGYFLGYRGWGYGSAPGYTAVPFVGPILSMNATRDTVVERYEERRYTYDRVTEFYATYNVDMAVFAVPSLVLQVAGVSLTIAGAVVRRRELVYPAEVARGTSLGARVFERVALVPLRTPTLSGLAVAGAF